MSTHLSNAVEVAATYADLAERDIVVDKAGGRWTALDVVTDEAGVSFWLADPTTGAKTHHLSAVPADKPVTLLREAPAPAWSKDDVPLTPDPVEVVADQGVTATDTDTLKAAVDLVVEELGGVEVVEEATGVAPEPEVVTSPAPAPAEVETQVEDFREVPAFADLTLAERLSHLFLTHGVYCADVNEAPDLVKIHDDAHAQLDAGTVKIIAGAAHVHAAAK